MESAIADAETPFRRAPEGRVDLSPPKAEIELVTVARTVTFITHHVLGLDLCGSSRRACRVSAKALRARERS
jgi:hypothetical protein